MLLRPFSFLHLHDRRLLSLARRSFRFHQGPLFANLVLADEINRAPAKVQSALLEAMQERQVTIGDQTYQMNIMLTSGGNQILYSELSSAYVSTGSGIRTAPR